MVHGMKGLWYEQSVVRIVNGTKSLVTMINCPVIVKLAEAKPHASLSRHTADIGSGPRSAATDSHSVQVLVIQLGRSELVGRARLASAAAQPLAAAAMPASRCAIGHSICRSDLVKSINFCVRDSFLRTLFCSINRCKATSVDDTTTRKYCAWLYSVKIHPRDERTNGRTDKEASLLVRPSVGPSQLQPKVAQIRVHNNY